MFPVGIRQGLNTIVGAPGLNSMGTAPTSSGSLLMAEGFPVALYAGATMLASILYSSAPE
jgi:hypothetical protein